MKVKKVYLGQELNQEDWDYGIGSMYLAGPRNPKGHSWRLDLINKLEEQKSPISILVPETKAQLNGGESKLHSMKIYEWQHLAMSVASCILFWYPAGVVDAQSYVEFGAWHKSERIFLGREKVGQMIGPNQYLDWLLHKEQKLYPAEDMDQLVQMAIHWIRE